MPTIAVVNNEESIRRFVREALREEGYRVREYADTESAQELLDLPADLAILDRTNYPLKGPELFRLIRQRWSMPVVFVTGSPLLEKELAAMRHKPQAVLDLPIMPADIVVTVKRLLG
jgi:DNA-binding response OmpR family regulator